MPIKKISIDIMNQQTLKKFKIQNSIAFLHINNRNSEKIKKTILFTIASKLIKYLIINLTRDTVKLHLKLQDIYKIN